MSISIKTDLKNIEQMQKKLRQLGTRKALRAPSSAVRAGSSVIIKAARRLVPIDTGTLKKGITQKVKNYRRSKLSISTFGARNRKVLTKEGYKNPVRYAHLVEFGTRRGAKANPFLRKAFSQNAAKARDAVINKMKQIFDSEAKRLR